MVGLVPKLATVAFAAATVWYLREMLIAAASTHWPSTEGLVLDAYFDEEIEYDDNRKISRPRANVRYRFKVGRKDYESTRLSYQPRTGFLMGDVTPLLRGVIKGRPVDVYYDPADPRRSVIIPGGTADNVIHAIVPMAAFVVMVWLQMTR